MSICSLDSLVKIIFFFFLSVEVKFEELFLAQIMHQIEKFIVRACLL